MYRNEKIGIGIGVPAGVVLLTLIVFFGLRWRRTRGLSRSRTAASEPAHVYLPDDLPPPYPGNDNDSRSRMERLPRCGVLSKDLLEDIQPRTPYKVYSD